VQLPSSAAFAPCPSFHAVFMPA